MDVAVLNLGSNLEDWIALYSVLSARAISFRECTTCHASIMLHCLY